MHEYSIAYDLYATAKKTALDHHATRVKKISVDVGKMAMVNPEQVIFLFDTIKEDDPLFTAAVLECAEVEPATKCPCGYAGKRDLCLSPLRGAAGSGPGPGNRRNQCRD